MPETRVWFITGAATGLGRALAEAALAKGDRVVAAARRVERLDELQGRFPHAARTVELDVTDFARAEAVVWVALDAFGRIDVLVNNAGATAAGAFEEFTETQVRALFETNVFGVMNVTRAVLPVLRRQGSGHILNVSSLAGHLSFPGVGVYSATKFAVEGLSEALAQELAPLGVKLTIVEPGPLRTGLTARMTRARPTDAYAHVHEFLKATEAQHRLSSGDPARAAAAMIAAVEAEAPPSRLPLGRDGLAPLRAKLEAELREFAVWEAVSLSTDARPPAAGCSATPAAEGLGPQ